MGKKTLNTRNDELDQQIEQEREERAKKIESSGQDGYRLRIEDGLNVLWVVPGLGETKEAINDMLIHFRPYHRCGREDPVPDPDADGGYKKDGDFSNCYRCQQTWNHWEATGKAGGKYKAKFSADMENHQAIFQAIDFSPFFKLDSKKKYAMSNKKVIEAHLEDFLKIVAVDKTTEEGLEEAEGLVPEDMPEEMAEKALASPGIIGTNSKVGEQIREATDEVYMRTEEDPLAQPDKQLVQIIRTNDGDTFTGANGQERKKKSYSVRMTVAKYMKAWDVDKDELIDILLDVGKDIQDMEPADDSLQARAYALERFDDDTMKEYMDEQEHSFEPDFGDTDDEEEEAELDPDNFDEDDFDEEDVLTTDDHAEAEKLKEEMAAE